MFLGVSWLTLNQLFLLLSLKICILWLSLQTSFLWLRKSLSTDKSLAQYMESQCRNLVRINEKKISMDRNSHYCVIPRDEKNYSCIHQFHKAMASATSCHFPAMSPNAAPWNTNYEITVAFQTYIVSAFSLRAYVSHMEWLCSLITMLTRCNGIAHKKPKQRASWDPPPHGVDGCYLGPTTDHYRCKKVHINNKKSIQNCGYFGILPSQGAHAMYSIQGHGHTCCPRTNPRPVAPITCGAMLSFFFKNGNATYIFKGSGKHCALGTVQCRSKPIPYSATKSHWHSKILSNAPTIGYFLSGLSIRSCTTCTPSGSNLLTIQEYCPTCT
jgi:hypothetical protein